MSHPFLMHATLAFSANTSQAPVAIFLANPNQYRQNAIAEAYHWHRVSHLFREELNPPLGLEFHNMDPILTTSMLLSRQSYLLDDGKLEFPMSFVKLPAENTATAVNWFTVQSGVKSLLIAFQPHISKSVLVSCFHRIGRLARDFLRRMCRSRRPASGFRLAVRDYGNFDGSRITRTTLH
jgi:hypothetical protein